MSVQSAIQKLQDELQRRFRIAGRGSVTRVQEALNLGGGYFRDLRRPERQRLDLRVLIGALDVLGVDSAEFFGTVFGSSDPVDSFLTEATELRRKMRRPPRILRQMEELTAAAAKSEARADVEPIDDETLEHFDALRRDNPREAMRQIRQAVATAPRFQLPRLLGSYGSACRFAGRTDEAHVMVAKAIKMAADANDLASRADLLQRASYILIARLEHERALAILERAIVTYAHLGNVIGIGRTLIDQGNSYAYLGQQEKACQLFRQGLSMLPAETSGGLQASQVSAQFNLAVVSLDLGRLEEAQHYAAKAREGMASQGKIAVGKALWFEASIAKAQNRREEAESFLSRALQVLHDIDALSAALVAVELVRWQFQIGKHVEAYATAKAMISLLKPLETNRIAAVAITDMARCALAGKGLSEKFLDQIASGLEGARSPQRSKKR